MSEILPITGDSIDDPDALMQPLMLNIQCTLMPEILPVRRSYVDASAPQSYHQSLNSIIPISDGDNRCDYDWCCC